MPSVVVIVLLLPKLINGYPVQFCVASVDLVPHGGGLVIKRHCVYSTALVK